MARAFGLEPRFSGGRSGWRRSSSGIAPLPAPASRLTAGLATAAHLGLCGTGIDPVTGLPVPQRSLLDRLVGHASAALDAAGDTDHVTRQLRLVDERGTGAARQRTLWTQTGACVEFIEALAHATLAA